MLSLSYKQFRPELHCITATHDICNPILLSKDRVLYKQQGIKIDEQRVTRQPYVAGLQ
jgi:hypothetical protein